MKLNKSQQARFDDVCKKAKIKSWKKEILILYMETLKDKKITDNSKEIIALRKLAKYILTGKK